MSHAAPVRDRAVKDHAGWAKNCVKGCKEQPEHSERDSREVQGVLGMEIKACTFANAGSLPGQKKGSGMQQLPNSYLQAWLAHNTSAAPCRWGPKSHKCQSTAM